MTDSHTPDNKNEYSHQGKNNTVKHKSLGNQLMFWFLLLSPGLVTNKQTIAFLTLRPKNSNYQSGLTGSLFRIGLIID